MEGSETLASVGEFQLIQEIFMPMQTASVPGVMLGIGDDAAVLAIPRTQQLVTTVDTLVEGVHFEEAADPFRLGQKALLVNLSDIAAMGGKPCWYLLSLSLPKQTLVSWVREFARGLQVVAERFKVTVVGGNTTGSGSGRTIGITMFGLVAQHRALTRAGSVPGDRILVSGTIGDAALALAVRQGRLPPPDATDLEFFNQRLDLPEPRIELGLAMADAAVVHGVIDLSDGLVADLGHLCRASGVGAQVDAAKVPLSLAARRQLERDPLLLGLLLTGGEDYELLCTAPVGAVELLFALAKDVGIVLTEIGELTATPEINVLFDNKNLALGSGGWTHF